MNGLELLKLMFLLQVGLALSAAPCHAQSESGASRGYLYLPPVFLRDEHDIPVATFGAYLPAGGKTLICASAAAPESDGFHSGGVDAQPLLKLNGLSVKAGLIHGFGAGWAAGFMVPYAWTGLSYGIGGFPATGRADGPGGLLLFAKKSIGQTADRGCIVGTAGIELPTGRDDYTFDQSNYVTNAYYRGYPRRMPLSWQPCNGAVNLHFVLGYLHRSNRVSYEGLLAYKIHGKGDEDVKLGNVLLASANATYGLSKKTAFAVGLVLRSQGDDSYPNAPAPGVMQAALAGTTTHGWGLYLDPTIRMDITRHITVGVGLSKTLVEPEDGLVPRSRLFLILYPNF
jgi:hypothetical protein